MIRTVACTSVIIGLVSTVHGADIPVGPGQSIQAALNSASPGDTIVVAPGTYNEAIDFIGKAVTVRSSGGAEATILDASGMGTSAVMFTNGEGSESVLEGLTIKGGTGFQAGTNSFGGGVRASNASPTINDCNIVDNSASLGGGLYLFGGQATVTNCRISGNVGGLDNGSGGGGIFVTGGSPVIKNCEFTDNDAQSGQGGGVALLGGGLQIINSVFAGNTALVGGGVGSSTGFLTIVNCTFSANSAFAGGAVNDVSAFSWIYNSIFWGNGSQEIYTGSTTNSTMQNCNVQGGWNGPGSDNMDEEPSFVDADNHNFRLADDSACIDMGDDALVPSNVNADLDGNERFVGAVDLGAYEFEGEGSTVCLADLDGDSQVGFGDLLLLVAAWGTHPDGPPDLDGDNMVGLSDLLELIANWGACP